jgi:hypothetical protein
MIRSRTTIAAGLLATGLAAMMNFGGADAAAQKLRVQQPPTAMAEQIVGTWRLVSIYEENAGGYDIDQFGLAPRGLFMVDRQGNYSFQIMSNDGRRLSAATPPAVVPVRGDGLLEAMTYFGAYSIDEAKRRLTLHVTHCLFRSCDRTDRTAELKIRGDMLELTSAVEPSPTGAASSYTVWKRECCI